MGSHRFYFTANGSRYPAPHDWEGKQSATEQGDRIGLPLDLDQGSMTVWKNDEKLGVMQAEGLDCIPLPLWDIWSHALFSGWVG